ncbi:MAG TPA: DUF92 domain-containing protein [Ktedonobacterales bacterium]|nr:DUF92 domain-containing protein [Ktedonobacterales bacterium]
MRQRVAARVAGAAAASAAIATFAHRRGLLDTGGAAGAVVTGTAITSAGGLDWAATLVYFFASSSALSRVFAGRKRAIEREKFAKGGRRDLGQVAANGGVATALALARALPWARRWREPVTAAFVAALAAATADTWATEVGTLSRRPPRLITSGRVVERGTSGGVSALGMGATVAGATSLSGFFTLAGWLARRDRLSRGRWVTFAAGAVGGVAGSLTDSALGAAWQAVYRCPRCRVETEQRIHHCGTPTELVRGLPWLDNDGVNALSTAVGALAGAAFWHALRQPAQLPCGD